MNNAIHNQSLYEFKAYLPVDSCLQNSKFLAKEDNCSKNKHDTMVIKQHKTL